MSERIQEHEELLRSPKKLENLYLKIRLLLDRNMFVPNMARVKAFLEMDRSFTTSKPNVLIPIGCNYEMLYSGDEHGGVNDRGPGDYQSRLFPDDFFGLPKNNEVKWNASSMVRQAMKRQVSQSQFGGYTEAFSSGKKVVLDIGSGQALGLLVFSQLFPHTTFIGVDRLYKEKKHLYPKAVGVQLTYDDWTSLSMVPDNSVDTIISLQAVGIWGIPGGFSDEATQKDAEDIVISLMRVAKVGCTIRIDSTKEGIVCLEKLFKVNTDWEIGDLAGVFIARRVK